MNPIDLYRETELEELLDNAKRLSEESESIRTQLDATWSAIKRVRLQLGQCPNCGKEFMARFTLYYYDVIIGSRFFHEYFESNDHRDMRRYCDVHGGGNYSGLSLRIG